MGSVEVDFFNKDLVDTENNLKLNVGEDTKLASATGKAVKVDDLKEQHFIIG